jgi:hypothetical protein
MLKLPGAELSPLAVPLSEYCLVEYLCAPFLALDILHQRTIGLFVIATAMRILDAHESKKLNTIT